MNANTTIKALETLSMTGHGADTRREAAREANELRAASQSFERGSKSKYPEDREEARLIFARKIESAKRFLENWKGL